MLLKSTPSLEFLDILASTRQSIREYESGRLDGACCEQTVNFIEDRFRALHGYMPRVEEESDK